MTTLFLIWLLGVILIVGRACYRSPDKEHVKTPMDFLVALLFASLWPVWGLIGILGVIWDELT